MATRQGCPRSGHSLGLWRPCSLQECLSAPQPINYLSISIYYRDQSLLSCNLGLSDQLKEPRPKVVAEAPARANGELSALSHELFSFF